ncbi:hypothetical protein Micbo1qcDRAFT_201488 [Microdochium bolleyi]|uniref:O-methyltransferase domain-containing protein n=1 Tax=Microdochium bolleyi TaxID=196109 RepID=A0A136JG79_9PEZI|nr:hypothetical protein Micbo1qcDRAFT_201488 [Microdochium bolleyi]
MTDILTAPVHTVINGAKNLVSSTNVSTYRSTIDVKLTVSANDFSIVPDILGDISALSIGLYPDDTKRCLRVLEKARELGRALETPRETMIKHTWAQLSIDPAPLTLFLQHINAMDYITETEPDEYKLTNFAKSLSPPIIADSDPVCLWSVNTTLTNLHDYLKSGSCTNANSTTDGNYQRAHNRTPHGVRFNNLMSGYCQGRPSWMDKGSFPAKENLLRGFDPTQGGGARAYYMQTVLHDWPDVQRVNGGHIVLTLFSAEHR